MELSINSISNL